MSNEKLTGENLKSYSGHTVQVMLDGKPVLADLNAESPAKILLTVAKISHPPDIQWDDMRPYVLSDDDISTLSTNRCASLRARSGFGIVPADAWRTQEADQGDAVYAFYAAHDGWTRVSYSASRSHLGYGKGTHRRAG